MKARQLARIVAAIALGATVASAQARRMEEVALVANSADGTVAVVDPVHRVIVGKVDINPERTRATGPGAANYAQDTDVSPDGRTLYVSRGYLGDVAAFDLESGRLLWKTSLNTGRADHMAITADGRTLFVSAMLDNRVYRIDTEKGELRGYVVAGVYPHDNKVSADGRLLYNTSIGALRNMPRPAGAAPLTETPGSPFQLTIVDVATFTVRDRIRTEFAIRPWEFAPDEKTLYAQIADQHAVIAYDVGARRFGRRLDLPVKAGITTADYDFEAPHHGLGISPDGRTLCLAARASDYVALVRAPELTLIDTIGVGDAPGWAEVADNGNVCLVTNTRSDDLSIISLPQRRELSRLAIGDGPKHVTIAHIPASILTAINQRSKK